MGKRVQFVSAFVRGVLPDSENMLENFLLSPEISSIILGMLQQPFKNISNDKFLQLRCFTARYNAGMSTNGMKRVIQKKYDLVSKKSLGKISVNREFIVQLTSDFGKVSVAKLMHSTETQRHLRKLLLESCKEWVPKRMEFRDDGAPMFVHPSTYAFDFLSCVKSIIYGVASSAGSFTTRFTTSSVEGVQNINLKLGGDGTQRTRKQAATQVRLMSPDIPTLFGERNDLVNLMQFGANVSEAHKDVQADLRAICEILRKQKENPLDYVVTVYPNSKTEQNIGEQYTEVGNPPVLPERFSWTLWMNQDLSFLAKLMGSTGAGGLEPCDVAHIPKAHAGEPLVFPCVDPNDPNDFGRKRFLHVLSTVVKPAVTNKKFDAVFASEKGMTSRLVKYYDAEFYEGVNREMNEQRALELAKFGLDHNEVNDINDLPKVIKEAIFDNLKKYAAKRNHGFYKKEIPVDIALKITYDSMHPVHNHAGLHTSSLLMIAFDFGSVFANRYPNVPVQDIQAVWGVRPDSVQYESIVSLKSTLAHVLKLLSEMPRLANIAAKAEKALREEGATITASKLVFRFDDACVNEYINSMFVVKNYLMEQVEKAEQLHPECDDDWCMFKEVFMCLFWDLLYFREICILACSSELTTDQIDLFITSGVDLLSIHRVPGTKTPFNLR